MIERQTIDPQCLSSPSVVTNGTCGAGAGGDGSGGGRSAVAGAGAGRLGEDGCATNGAIGRDPSWTVNVDGLFRLAEAQLKTPVGLLQTGGVRHLTTTSIHRR